MRLRHGSEHGVIDVRDPLLRDQFAQLPMSIFCAQELSTGAKLAYSMLLRLAWEGRGYPGHQACSDRFGPSVASIKRYVAELHEWGLINGYRASYGSTNSYQVFRPDDPECKLDLPQNRLKMSLKGAQTEPEAGSELAGVRTDSVSDSEERDESPGADAPTAKAAYIQDLAAEFAPGQAVPAIQSFLARFSGPLLRDAAEITRAADGVEKPIAYLYGVVKGLASAAGQQGRVAARPLGIDDELSEEDHAAAVVAFDRVKAWVDGGRQGPPPS
ncbi:unnamed protein product [marine sediment metagenome]|uniref:Helix-turn-helix domain-containing protein n=1 Tax=marine sediment metagenome TaxID=412755 RepID=X1QKM7_9ZZZZ